MIEGIMAWFCLALTAISAEPEWAVAAGVFAVAAHLSRILGIFEVEENEEE